MTQMFKKPPLKKFKVLAKITIRDWTIVEALDHDDALSVAIEELAREHGVDEDDVEAYDAEQLGEEVEIES
jgi:hypothetical protein